MIFIGIDPGLDGAVALVGEAGDLIDVIDTPTLDTGKRRELDLTRMWAILRRATPEVVHVAIEAVHAMPGQGVTSMFSFGFGLGAWRAFIVALELPHSTVTPQAWRGLLLAGFPPVSEPRHRKAQSAARCQQIWPDDANRFRGPRGGILDGRADAALIAMYSRMWWQSRQHARK